jgi:hypothetical protein
MHFSASKLWPSNVVNKTDTSKMSPMPLLFTRNNENSTKLNHPCTCCRQIRHVHLFSVNCDDEKWSAHFYYSKRNKSYLGPWRCTKTCITISLLSLPAPGSWKNEDRDECLTWIRFPLRIESRDIQPTGWELHPAPVTPPPFRLQHVCLCVLWFHCVLDRRRRALHIVFCS